MKNTADYNLLFGILALQMDFVNREQLVAAMNAWVLEKSSSLGAILSRQKALDKDEQQLLEALVAKHLAKHGGDAEKSLAAVSSIETARDELRRLADADIQASLAHVPRDRGTRDLAATLTPSMGESTSSGLRFRVLRPHARGGLGEVLVAKDEEFGREVALKQIQSHYADDPDSRGRFLLEAEITGGLEHPGIVPVYGLGSYANGRPFYAMRFIRGDSLKDAIESFHSPDSDKLSAGERTLHLRKLLGRFIDVCNAVEYAHSRGVLHRDLKPGNIMLGKYGETLVVDWGLAKPMGQVNSSQIDPAERALQPSSASGTAPERMGAAIGTPQYMSPEQAAGQLDQLGPASDVYSLGATLYCLLTGKAPMSDQPANDIGKILRRVQAGDFPSPRKLAPDIPKPLEAICLKAMALNQADRYSSPRALGDDLENWLADEPVAANDETLMERASRWARRHRPLVRATAAATLIVAAVAVIAAILIERQRRVAENLAVERDAARIQAESGFHEAQNAVDDLFTRVSEDTLLNQPGTQELRKELLRKTLVYYKRFIEERADDPTLQDELGLTYFRAGRIVKDVESPQEALHYYDDAQKLQERLLAAAPSDPNRMKALADTYNAIGEAQHRGQRLEEARKTYQQALDIREQLAKHAPKDAENRRLLANSYMNIGLEEMDNGHLDVAGRKFQQAQKIRSELLNDGPASLADTTLLRVQRDVAMGYYNQGNLDRKRDDLAAAGNSFSESIRQFAALVKLQPRDMKLRENLALCYRLLGDLRAKEGAVEESNSAYAHSIETLARLVERNPDVAEYASVLAGVYMNLGSRQKGAASLASFEQARKLLRELVDKYPDNPQWHCDLAVTHRSLARLETAAGHADKAKEYLKSSLDELTALVKQFPANSEYTSQLAETKAAVEAQAK
jgi:eukaryotic-like serine/threonine-protein kinase